MSKQNVEQFLDALAQLEDRGSVDPMLALFSTDVELTNPLHPHPHKGLDAARAFWTAYRGTFHGVHSEFQHVLEGEHTAMLEWVSRGRLANGRDVTYAGVSVLEFRDGAISRFRAYFDPVHLTRALRASQAPSAAQAAGW
ncbi:MAG: nuclear transport factor 2 family protein [Myxococcota bacterium]